MMTFTNPILQAHAHRWAEGQWRESGDLFVAWLLGLGDDEQERVLAEGYPAIRDRFEAEQGAALFGPHVCYERATVADEAFSRALRADGFNRWDGRDAQWTPAIREAYAAKVQADRNYTDSCQRAETCHACGAPYAADHACDWSESADDVARTTAETKE